MENKLVYFYILTVACKLSLGQCSTGCCTPSTIVLQETHASEALHMFLPSWRAQAPSWKRENITSFGAQGEGMISVVSLHFHSVNALHRSDFSNRRARVWCLTMKLLLTTLLVSVLK